MERRSIGISGEASTEDTAKVEEIHEGNISFAYSKKGEALPVIVDTGVIFSYDTSLSVLYGFKNQPLHKLFEQEQVTNQ